MMFINAQLSFAEFEQEYRKKYNPDQMRGVRLQNANGDISQATLGYQYAIDTLTYIRKKIVDQKFYEIEFAEFVPVAVGEGSFYQSITTNLVMNAAGDFSQGDINQGIGNARLGNVEAGISPVNQKINNWAIGTSYNVIEVQQAVQANNWDVVETRQKARKKMWDLGLQKICFLGHPSDDAILGLLNQTTVNSNLSVIAKKISSMTSSEFATFVAAILSAYLSNCNNTALPTHFAIPLADYVSLATPLSSTYPVISMLTYLKDAFKQIVPGGVEIVPLAYCDTTYNSLGKTRYCLYRKDEDTLLMNIPVDLTITQPNTMDNFNFQDAGYGQYSGVQAFRPLEILYFDF